jgi:hypothetical protein
VPAGRVVQHKPGIAGISDSIGTEFTYYHKSEHLQGNKTDQHDAIYTSCSRILLLEPNVSFTTGNFEDESARVDVNRLEVVNTEKNNINVLSTH